MREAQSNSKFNNVFFFFLFFKWFSSLVLPPRPPKKFESVSNFTSSLGRGKGDENMDELYVGSLSQKTCKTLINN